MSERNGDDERTPDDEKPAGSEQPSTPDEPADGESATTPGADEVYCRDCGAVISERAEICPECGVRQRSSGVSTEELIDVLTNGENPFVAAVYSAILPGLGQFYNREPKKGAIIVIAGMIAAFSVVAFVGLLLFPAVWLYAVYDAYVVAERNKPDT